jgi:hypothetical protein
VVFLWSLRIEVRYWHLVALLGIRNVHGCSSELPVELSRFHDSAVPCSPIIMTFAKYLCWLIVEFSVSISPYMGPQYWHIIMGAVVCLTLMCCHTSDVRNCMKIMAAECHSVEHCGSQLLIFRFPKEFCHLLNLLRISTRPSVTKKL